MKQEILLETLIYFGIPKVVIVIAILIVANVIWSYFKRRQRRSEDKKAQVHRQKAKGKKPSDESIGEYVDYEEVDD